MRVLEVRSGSLPTIGAVLLGRLVLLGTRSRGEIASRRTEDACHGTQTKSAAKGRSNPTRGGKVLHPS